MDRGQKVFGVETIRVPNDMNRNMFAQQGMFTTSNVTPLELGSSTIDRRPANDVAAQRIEWLGDEASQLRIPLMYRVRVPARESREILWRLNREGINCHRLFPDFAHIVRSMREESFYHAPEFDYEEFDRE
jgi:hypothetical protein